MATAITTTVDPLTSNTGADFFRTHVDLIDPHPENPRRVTDDHPSLPGLAETIKSVGLINPITVQQVGDRYRILAGERRWRAARLAGMAEVLVRILDVTDEQVFFILNVENLQREGLHWTEEARGVEAMIKKGWPLATIAKHLGRSEQWVQLRAKLTGISPTWRQAVEDPKHDMHGWPTSMLELVARFPIATQDEILANGSWDLLDCKTAADLRSYLDRQYLRSLKQAPWALADTQLVPKAGSCVACPKRTSCQQQLFSEAKDDRCTDDSCWKSKLSAHVASAVHNAFVAEPTTLVIGHAEGLPPKIAKQAKSAHEYDAVGPKAKGAVPAVFVSGDKAGTTGWVVKAKGYSSDATSERRGPGSVASTKAKETPAKERLAEFMKRRTRKAIGLLVAKLGGNPDESPHAAMRRDPKAQAADVKYPNLTQLVSLAMSLGIEGDDPHGGRAWKPFEKHMQGGDEARARALWQKVRSKLIPSLMFDAEQRADATGAKVVAACCGLRWPELVEAARDAMPLPKTLAAHFDQNGQPLRGLTAKPKPTAKPKAGAAAAKA